VIVPQSAFTAINASTDVRTSYMEKQLDDLRAQLDNATIEVAEGERVGLIGPNGAGKTTFFNCILGVIPMDGGAVELNGHDVTGLPVQARAMLGTGTNPQVLEIRRDGARRTLRLR